MNSTDELTLEGAQQDWAVVINPYANRRQRLVCMHRLGMVDVQTRLRLITPMVELAIDNMTDPALLEDVNRLMREATQVIENDMMRRIAGG